MMLMLYDRRLQFSNINIRLYAMSEENRFMWKRTETQIAYDGLNINDGISARVEGFKKISVKTISFRFDEAENESQIA